MVSNTANGDMSASSYSLADNVALDRQQAAIAASRTLLRSPSHTLREARVQDALVPDQDTLVLQAADEIPGMMSGMTLGTTVSPGMTPSKHASGVSLSKNAAGMAGLPLSGASSALPSDDEAMSAMTAAVQAAKAGVRNTAHKRASRPHTNSARPLKPGRKAEAAHELAEARAPTPAMYWSRRSTWGERPPQMRSQTMTVIGSGLFVFGGWNNAVCYNDVYVLDTETMFWTRMKTSGDAVPPCRAHTATAVGYRLFVFGGGDGTQYFSDLYVLDVRTCVWERAKVAGAVPAPRRTHTCFHHGGYVYLFGGGDGHRALNDLWRVGTEPDADGAYAWEEVETAGGRPFPRGYHTSTLVGSQLVVFGGSDGQECFGDTSLLNLETMEWAHVAIDPPLTRLAHTATLVGMYLFVICGHDGADYSSQVLMLKLDTLKWETRMIYGAAPIPRGYHACALHDGRLFLHGGYNGQEVFDDLYSLELSSYSYLPQVPEFVIGCHR